MVADGEAVGGRPSAVGQGARRRCPFHDDVGDGARVACRICQWELAHRVPAGLEVVLDVHVDGGELDEESVVRAAVEWDDDLGPMLWLVQGSDRVCFPEELWPLFVAEVSEIVRVAGRPSAASRQPSAGVVPSEEAP